MIKHEENPCFYLEDCRLNEKPAISSTTHLTASMYRSAKLLCNSEYIHKRKRNYLCIVMFLILYFQKQKTNAAYGRLPKYFQNS